MYTSRPRGIGIIFEPHSRYTSASITGPTQRVFVLRPRICAPVNAILLHFTLIFGESVFISRFPSSSSYTLSYHNPETPHFHYALIAHSYDAE